MATAWVVAEPIKKSKTISFLSVESSKTRLIKSSGLGLVKTSDPNICRKCLVADVFVLVFNQEILLLTEISCHIVLDAFPFPASFMSS